MIDARTLTDRLGGKWHSSGDYGMACCPAHDDRNPSLSIRDGDKELILKCHAGCDWRVVKDTLRQSGDLDPFIPGEAPRPRTKPARDESDAERVKWALRLWYRSVPPQDTLAQKYFAEHRRLDIGALGGLSHAIRYYAGERIVIALMTDPVTGEPCGAHRTYLNPDASKRGKPLMLGKWGAVRLSPDEQVTTHLAIAEGIEKCLSIMLDGVSPVWCAVCAGGVRVFPVLSGIEVLTIFADDDVAGTKGAEACVERWRKAGRTCIAVYPKDYSL